MRACKAADLAEEEVLRFDHGRETFAVYRGPDSELYCTAGLCTHEAIHLADGFVMDFVVECPKHNGQFDIRTGAPKGPPVCKGIKTFPVRQEGEDVLIQLEPSN